MCLITFDKTSRIADHDIVCYKYMKHMDYQTFMSPVQYAIFKQDIVYHEFKFCHTMTKRIRYSYKPASNGLLKYTYMVSYGYHLLCTIKSAELLRNTYKPFRKGVLVKCIVPEGSRYYVDADRPNYICASHFKIVAYKKNGKWVKDEPGNIKTETKYLFDKSCKVSDSIKL